MKIIFFSVIIIFVVGSMALAFFYRLQDKDDSPS